MNYRRRREGAPILAGNSTKRKSSNKFKFSLSIQTQQQVAFKMKTHQQASMEPSNKPISHSARTGTMRIVWGEFARAIQALPGMERPSQTHRNQSPRIPGTRERISSHGSTHHYHRDRGCMTTTSRTRVYPSIRRRMIIIAAAAVVVIIMIKEPGNRLSSPLLLPPKARVSLSSRSELWASRVWESSSTVFSADTV